MPCIPTKTVNLGNGNFSVGGGNSVISKREFPVALIATTGNFPDNLPDWASSGNWLDPEGHADLKNPLDDPSLYNLCSFPLKLFNDEAETMSFLNVFHLLTILSEKKCCLGSVIRVVTFPER